MELEDREDKMKNLTEGNTYKNLILFSLPILFGNLLQLTYNAVDSVIVGKYAGEIALAAVGISNPIMSILILGASGVSIGASAYTGKCYGAGKKEELKKAFASVLIIGIIMSAVIMIPGFLLTGTVLNVMQVPKEALMISEVYLRIILLSFPFTFLYNIITAVVRSVGDSKTPIYFLALSCGINVLLDLILVGQYQFGAAGAGIATLLAEMIACILCVIYIYKKIPVLSLKKEDWKFDKKAGKMVLSNGGVTAFQQFMQPIGKVLIQGCMDKYGISVIAAFNAVNRIDDFACIPEQSISHAMMNYISQCDGAGKDGKKKEGFRKGMILELIYGILIFGVVYIFRSRIIRIFGGGRMAEIGESYLGVIAIFYILPGITNGIQGYFRGIQKMKITLISTCIQITLRVLAVYSLTPLYGMNGAAYACAIGWSVMIVYQMIMVWKYQKK